MDSKYNRKYAITKLKELASVLKQNGIEVNSIFLFGSYVNENQNLDMSDIDAAIISNSFSGFRFEDNKILIPFAAKIEPRIETHPFTVSEFENSPFAKDEIVSKGIEIDLH